jgi:hypothetical protein
MVSKSIYDIGLCTCIPCDENSLGTEKTNLAAKSGRVAQESKSIIEKTGRI